MSEPSDDLPIRTSLNTRRAFVKALVLGVAASTAGTRPVLGQTARGDKVMRTIVSEGLGRVVILSFDHGEKLREGIRDKLKELGIRNAVLLSAIGTFEKARFHRIKNTNRSRRTRFSR